MPWSADIDPFYWDFGNGYIPFFVVIGAYNILMYGDNGVAGAINTVPDAIASFDEMGVVNPIGDQTMYFGDSYDYDVSDLFGHPYGEPVVVYVNEISDPNIVDAVIVDNILTLTALNTMGTANVSLYGIGGALMCFYDFNVTVFDPNSASVDYQLEDSPYQEIFPNNPNPFSNSLTDLGWTSINVQENGTVVEIMLSLDWNSLDYPTEGSLWMSNDRIEVQLYQSTATGLIHLDLTTAAFATEELNGTWNIYMLDSYGDGGHQVTNATVTFNYIPESGTEEDTTPLNYDLLANYPNPFNPSTTIGYSLKNQDHVSLVIFNSKGQQISTLVNTVQDAGSYNVVWNGRDNYGQTVSSGIYFYKLKAGRFTSTKKMILMK